MSWIKLKIEQKHRFLTKNFTLFITLNFTLLNISEMKKNFKTLHFVRNFPWKQNMNSADSSVATLEILRSSVFPSIGKVSGIFKIFRHISYFRLEPILISLGNCLILKAEISK